MFNSRRVVSSQCTVALFQLLAKLYQSLYIAVIVEILLKHEHWADSQPDYAG